ncbi:MAG: hypothetical protein HON98_13525 [Chloroflexi bacterium]|jgi:hypothetical protein|nr:hypothetical protein [Chloroflexota bacterium]MBT3669226.1 hypothetical protein [Chloroflexota bacterium]MBT4534970.1 hypothetical protein [Chloroflexota bacterium]MBT4682288.1 hypothetical protein [Chloroflexota bacterium]MBT4756690.1 hypothetical protein [Chloroflexota bacterium]
MFSIKVKNRNLGLILPKDERLLFLDDPHVKLREAYGTAVKEYVRSLKPTKKK